MMARLRKTVVRWAAKQLALSGVDTNRGWVTLFKSDLGWQTDASHTTDDVVAHVPVYSCATLISSDIGKICLRLMTLERGVWSETTSPAFSPVLKKPNHFQTRQQFVETWVLSKLLSGNTYVLKVRDGRGVVVSMYVLDPNRVTPLVAPDGSVYYQLRRDDLSKLAGDFPAVPASEIIHDRMECLFHPLVGISPLWAAHLSGSLGLRILKSSEKFFENMSRPSGLLTSPHEIDDEDAKRLKDDWEKNFTGKNAGRMAVVGGDLKYVNMAATAADSQLAEQLKLSAEQVCSAFHVPAYMIGAGTMPTYNNVEALNQQYYTQCLQKLFNAIEDLLDDGLGLTAAGYRCEFDLDDLLRMDSAARAEALSKLVGAAIMAPDEARAKFGLAPVPGGKYPLAQQQNYSLGALAKRDAQEDPFGTAKPPAAEPDEDEARALADYIEKAFA